jgi:hypothetical protein
MNDLSLHQIARRITEIEAPNTIVDSLDEFYDSSDQLYDRAMMSDNVKAVVEDFHEPSEYMADNPL